MKKRLPAAGRRIFIYAFVLLAGATTLLWIGLLGWQAYAAVSAVVHAIASD